MSIKHPPNNSNAKSGQKKAPLTAAEITAARLRLIRDIVSAAPPSPPLSEAACHTDLTMAMPAAVAVSPAANLTLAEPAPSPAAVTVSSHESVPNPSSAPLDSVVSAPAPAHEAALPDPLTVGHALATVFAKSQPILQAYYERLKLTPPDASLWGNAAATMATPWLQWLQHVWCNPQKMADAQLSLYENYLKLYQNTTARLLGKPFAPIITPSPHDRRFKDAAWSENALFDFIKQSYLLTAQWVQQETQKHDDLPAAEQRKMNFYTRQFLDALSPSNFLFTNPAVLRATAESNGENLVKGLQNLLQDLERGEGQLKISMSDNTAFTLGKNIAATAGSVVYQNELMQLIHYTPQTATQHAAPLLIIPPWINKYYILDMQEQNSFVRYCLQQGHAVFLISWINPTAALAHKDFAAYMREGPLAAIQEIQRCTGAEAVNLVGYCIGGTLQACLLAYLAAQPTTAAALPRIASATYLVTMVDFSEPGELGVFMDAAQIEALERQMAEQGYLPAANMVQSFTMLRANDLIWSFVVNNYLLGREPFPFDLLYWNEDATNMPAAMHSFYLRTMYLENRLIQPQGVVLDGVPLDLRRITTPSFLLATREDHIAPWTSSYAATQIYGGKTTFMLCGSGHIAGVINPPAANKYEYWTNEALPSAPQAWLDNASRHSGSWWPAWQNWLAAYQGAEVPAYHPVEPFIENAPGSYVRARVK